MLKNNTLLMLLLTVCMLLTGCSTDPVDSSILSDEVIVPEQENYETVKAVFGVYKKEAHGSASLEYPIRADVTLDNGNAYLQEIKVRKNQNVKKGDVLAVYTTEVSAAQKVELQLKLQRKIEEFEQGKTARLEEINEAKANLSGLSSHQLEIARLQLKKLEIIYEQYVYQMEREIASHTERLDFLEQMQMNNTLVAPFDGVIQSVSSNLVGEQINTTDVIVSVYSEEAFYLRVKDAGNKLRYGMDVSIETGRKNDKKYYTGVVVAAPNVLSSSMNQTDAYIQIKESVTPDEFENSITFRSYTEYLEDVLIVDRGATDMEEGRIFVNILEDGTVKKRYVVQGMANMDLSWILVGLQEGQLLIA